MSRSLDRVLALLGVALLLSTGAVALSSDKAGSSEQSAGATPAASPAEETDRVEIKEFKYEPVEVKVKVGTKVTFVNDDTAAHTATSKASGAFDSGSIRRGKSKTVVLKKAGNYDYYCAFHPFMRAKLQAVE